MKSKEETRLKYLLIILMAIWLIPWLEGNLQWLELQPLHGAIEKKQNLVLNERNWISGRFQKYKQEFLNDEFGFRNFFVRLNNQVDYSLFGKLHAHNVVIGKHDYLFEHNYVNAYYGRDYIGEQEIVHQVLLMKKIQDSLERLGKTFLFVITGSKGHYSAEFFPDSCIQLTGKTNYEVYVEKAKQAQINFIDFNALFLSLKKDAMHPLYSKSGIHWTYYGACLAADSLLHYIEQIRDVDLPELEWNKISLEPARDDDRNVELALNLLKTFPSETLAYPHIAYTGGNRDYKPSVMVVADSYYWSLFNLDLLKAFSRNAFWYYYSRIYEPGINGFKWADDKSLQKGLNKNDIVILLGADINLYNIGWGFLEKADSLLQHGFVGDTSLELKTDSIANPKPLPETSFEEKVRNLKVYIQTDSAWMSDIRTKASYLHISVDSMLNLDAIWMIEREGKNEEN